MIEVLIVDDHAVVRDGLASVLDASGAVKVTGVAGSGAEALALVRAKRFDVVLLDISMPKMNGLETLKQIRDERHDLPVIMLSLYPADQYALRCIKAGASGYLSKNCTSTDLLAAVRAAAAGRTFITPAVSECLISQFRQPESLEAEPHRALSDREFEVFQHIANGKQLTEIGQCLHLSPKTVSTYRARILEKMGLANNAAIMHYAFEHGLVQ